MIANPVKSKIYVLLHKKTARLVEYIPNSWFGGLIFYGMAVGDEPISDDTPIIFDDDKRYRLDHYEKLSEL